MRVFVCSPLRGPDGQPSASNIALARRLMRAAERIERALHETISFHEALRRLGYSADDIFVQCAPDGAREGKLSVFTLLRVRGLPEVNFTSGHFESDAESIEFEQKWVPFVLRWNGSEMKDGERQKIYEASFVARQPVGLISTLMRKGHTVELLQQDSLRKWFNA